MQRRPNANGFLTRDTNGLQAFGRRKGGMRAGAGGRTSGPPRNRLTASAVPLLQSEVTREIRGACSIESDDLQGDCSLCGEVTAGSPHDR
jgi:hypothetical protein